MLTCSDLFVVFFFFSSLPMHAVPFFLTLFGVIFSAFPFTERFYLALSYPVPFVTRAPDAAARMQPRDAPTSNCESNSFWPMECHRAWQRLGRVRPALTQIHHHPLDLLQR